MAGSTTQKQHQTPKTLAGADSTATTFIVDSEGEVRAGPGDAGAQDRPRVLDDTREKAPAARGTFLILLGVGLVLVVGAVLVASL